MLAAEKRSLIEKEEQDQKLGEERQRLAVEIENLRKITTHPVRILLIDSFPFVLGDIINEFANDTWCWYCKRIYMLSACPRCAFRRDGPCLTREASWITRGSM